jgi:hypothetical protein
VSRRSVTVAVDAVKQGRAQDATPTTIDPPHRHAAPSRVSYIPDPFRQPLNPWALLAVAQLVVLCARPRSLHPAGLRREDGTNAFWPQTLSRFSYVQCTTPNSGKSTRKSEVRLPVQEYDT